MQSTAPDQDTVMSIVKSTGVGVWAARPAPAGLVLVLSSDRAQKVTPVLMAAGYPNTVVNPSTLIVYGVDPVALIDAQIQALQDARTRLMSGASDA